MTHLNEISKIYKEIIAEGYAPGDVDQKVGAVTSIPKKEQEAAKERLLAKAAAKRASMKKEALDPVGSEDGDVDNDGDKDKSDKYLLKRRKAISRAIGKKKVATEESEVPSKNLKKLVKKAVKRIDTDVDGDVDNNDKTKGPMGEFVPSADGKKRVYSGVKEGFSNWRNDLIEVVKDEESAVKEKNVKNKIVINPELKESVEHIGGILLEATEFSDILEEISDEELYFLSDSMIEEIVEEVFVEAQEEGQDLEVFESILCESIDVSMMLLNEVTSPAKVNAARLKDKGAAARGEGQTAGRDAGAEARKRISSGSSGNSSTSRAEKLAKVKAAVKKVGAAVKAGVKKAAPVVRKAAVKSAEIAGKAVGKAKNLAKDMGSAAKKGYQSTQSASSSSSDSNSSSSSSSGGSSSSSGGSSSSSGGSSSGMTRPVVKKKPGLLSRIGSKLKSGLKKAVGKTARAVSRGTRNVARRMGEEVEPEEKKKEGPDAKDKQMLSQKKMMLNKQMMLQRKKLMLQKQGKLPMGGMNEENIEERADFWNPDPEKDRKLGGPGANQRAREDSGSSKPAAKKDYSKSLKPGETYMQFAKRKKAERMKKEEVEVVGEAKVDTGKSRKEKEEARNKRSGLDKTPPGALPIMFPNMHRRDEHEDKRGVKKEKGIKSVGEEFELDERTRYAKETGKDFTTGNKSEKGGEGRSEAGKHMQKMMRSTGGAMSSRRKAIQPQGKKKEKGAKGPKGVTPVDKIKGQLSKKRAPKADPYGYGQGRYQGD